MSVAVTASLSNTMDLTKGAGAEAQRLSRNADDQRETIHGADQRIGYSGAGYCSKERELLP